MVIKYAYLKTIKICALLNFQAPLFYCRFAVFSFICGIFSSPFNFSAYLLHELAPFNFLGNKVTYTKLASIIMSKSLVKFQNELFKDLLRKCKRNIPKTHKICLTMLIISSSWQNSKFFFTTQIATHVIAPQGVRHSLSKFTSPFLRFLPLIIPQPPYFATFYIHLLAMNLKIVRYF